MPPENEGLDSTDVSAALAALSAAQRRAIESGRTVVFVEDGKLVRKSRNEYTILRVLPTRQAASPRIKIAESRSESK